MTRTTLRKGPNAHPRRCGSTNSSTKVACAATISTSLLVCFVIVSMIVGSCTALPSITYVNKFRTWTWDTEPAQFRPNASLYVSSLPLYRKLVIQPKLARHSVAVQQSTGRLVCFGGIMERPDLPNQPFVLGTNHTFLYDPPTNSWYSEPTFSRVWPPARVDHTSWSVGDNIYIHGGENETVMADTWRYANRTWRMINMNMPNRTGHSSDVVDVLNDPGTAYIFGGRDDRERYHNILFAVTASNYTVRQIVTTTEHPSTRAFHASAVMQSPTKGPLLYIHGGFDGFTGLKDLFVYSVRSNRWTRINSGVSEASTGFAGEFIAAITLSPLYRHSCKALFPTIYCVGGKSTGDPITFEFDVVLNRFVQNFYTNANHLLPVSGHKTILYFNKSNLTEFLVIGGATGNPLQFSTPVTIQKTDAQMTACPWPYINTDWQGICHTCPSGSGYNVSINPHRCFACPMGTYSQNSACVKCPTGSYNPRNASGNATSCISCPKGYFTVLEGSWTRSQCITCRAGTYADHGKCLPCPSGSYGTMQGAMYLDEGCVPCPYGKFSELGATACTSCPPGTSGPTFIKALDVYQISLAAMDQALTGSPPNNGCGINGNSIPTLYNDQFFWVTVTIRDFGESGQTMLNAYNPLDINYHQPGLQLYAYFKGNNGTMYYNCRVGQEMIPGCSSVVAEQPTPMVSYSTAYCGYQFLLRFTTPSPSTTLYIRGDGLRGINMTFSVVNNYKTVSFEKWPTSFVVGQSRAITVYAWLNNAVEYSSSYAADILVQCQFLSQGTGSTLSPTYTVNNGGAANVQTVNVVNGSALINVDFVGYAKGCTFKSRDQFMVITQPNTWAAFAIEKPAFMYARLLTKNASMFGVMRVEVSMVDQFGVVIAGDNSSEVLVQLWETGTAVMQPTQMIMRLTNGVAVFAPTVHAKPPYNKKVPTYGRFHVIHLSGLKTLMKDNITARFHTHHVNGTKLQIVNFTTTIPSYVSVNTTLNLEIENVDRLTGEQDASRDVWVQVQLVGCGSRITLYNHSASVVRARLIAGRGVVSLYFQGYDSMHCKLNVWEYITGPKIAKGFTTQAFNVISPRMVVRDGCSKANCATCTAPYAGQVVNYNISLQTVAGVLAPVDRFVVRFIALGNKSAVVPADGITQRLIVGGNVTFPVLYLPSLNVTGVKFEVGHWVGRELINTTYITTPTFKRRLVSKGIHSVFVPNTAITPTSTCLVVPRILATQIVLASRLPLWVAQNDYWTVSILAVNTYGVIDTNYFGAISIQIQNCEHGVFKNLTVQSVNLVTNVATTLYSPTTVSNAAPFVVSSTFNHGQATLNIRPRFMTDSDWNGGVKHCDVRFASTGLTTLHVEAPEFRKLYPSCETCDPGYFSGGGDGRNTTLTYHHPGGCMPCAVGTFSAYSGATSQSACSACQTGYGYDVGDDNTLLEGAIQCTHFCPYGTGGQVGGGACAAYTTIGRADITTNRRNGYGRIGRVCVGGGCLAATACAAGLWYLNCLAQTTQATCEHVDNVGACVWSGGACTGQVFNCLPCPPGTIGGAPCTLCTKAAACASCDAGGWSNVRGQTSQVTNYNLAPYRCTGNGYTQYNHRCTGTGTGQCWNGTYSLTAGATSNDTCLPCPRGYLCAQLPIYTSANGCPPACATTQRSSCAQGCMACPFPELMRVGNFNPIPCPAGTFNNHTGQWLPSACRRCPAGMRCPAGSAVPILVDTLNTQESDGQAKPVGVTFYGTNDVTSCTNEAADNGEGYVADGRFTNYKTYWTNNGGSTYVPPTSVYVEKWSGKGWAYSPIDRLGDPASGSIAVNATGAIANQRVYLGHEMPIEMVARVWVQYNLYERNMSKLIPGSPKPFCGLTLGVHYTDGNEMDSYNYSGYAKKFAVTPPTVINSTKIIVGWYLIEVLVQPKRPIRWIDFGMLVQGYYFGTAVFDDASLKPSHRRICNCSTGYYFNQSEPTSRVCRRCPPGFACSGGTMIRCVNSWSAVSYAGCQFCYDGWECDADGRGRQIPCALYNRKDSATETCSPCPLGYACKDGQQVQCDNGFYGDGGLECIPCQPGYYSLPGSPRWQCQRCPAGSTSVHARWYCTACPDNHYSPNGTVCLRCPNGQFAPLGGANACRSCTNVFMEKYNITVSRNHLGFAIRVVPAYCEPWYKFKVERVVNLQHGNLGTAAPSTETPSVLYNAGPVVGTHSFRVFMTSGYLQPEQYADVTVHIINNAPIANDDAITFPHPKVDVVHNLTTLMSNDYDPDIDDIFFAYATQPATMTQYYAYGVSITPDRKTIQIHLPATFTGPAHVQYIIMDQYRANAADCLPPACRFSAVATASFYCVDARPQAAADAYSFAVGQVYSIDVLVNDVDIDGDDITITNVTAGSISGITPAIQQSCSTCPGTCLGSYTGSCTCAYDAQRLKCYPSNGRQYFLDYTANTGVCGSDVFTYTIGTNDGSASASVTVGNTRCYCMTKTVGFNMIFLLDGTTTTSDFGFQLALAEATAKRSSFGKNFKYGVIEVGANRVLQNLSNVYPDLDVMSRRRDGSSSTYTLGQGMRMAATMITTYGGTAPTYLIFVANKASFDNANIYETLGISARIMTITVSPTVQVLPMFQVGAFRNPQYQGHANAFVNLPDNDAILAENMMDIMCSN